jgi:hypothetical protein
LRALLPVCAVGVGVFLPRPHRYRHQKEQQ